MYGLSYGGITVPKCDRAAARNFFLRVDAKFAVKWWHYFVFVFVCCAVAADT